MLLVALKQKCNVDGCAVTTSSSLMQGTSQDNRCIELHIAPFGANDGSLSPLGERMNLNSLSKTCHFLNDPWIKNIHYSCHCRPKLTKGWFFCKACDLVNFSIGVPPIRLSLKETNCSFSDLKTCGTFSNSEPGRRQVSRVGESWI